MTDWGAMSATQLMAAGEAEVQVWRRPSQPELNLRRRGRSPP